MHGFLLVLIYEHIDPLIKNKNLWTHVFFIRYYEISNYTKSRTGINKLSTTNFITKYVVMEKDELKNDNVVSVAFIVEFWHI